MLNLINRSKNSENQFKNQGTSRLSANNTDT